MATTTHLLTWKEFENLPEEDGWHYEILDGELITLPPAKAPHSLVAENAADLLKPLKANGLGRVLREAGFKISENPPNWLQPDVCFLKMERVHAIGPDGYFHGAPELAIEIVSPSETARALLQKIRALLAAGGLAVWVIFPDEREVRVFLPDGTSYTRGLNATLSIPELLPGRELPVARLFENC